MGLTKATLQKLSSVVKGQTRGDEIPVQFNPTSLRLSVTNQTESGQVLGQRTRQYLASGSAKLTMQLVFDTADEAQNERPVSVRGKTRLVTQFLEPEAESKKQLPPAVRFHWGEFIFEGIMDSATEEIDFFAANGTPLRAKVDVTITGQRVNDLTLATGSGASKDGNAPTPGEAMSAGPGTSGGLPTDRTDTANGGESAAAFAARQGLDPASWRAFADQIEDPLSLPAGQAIDFSEAVGVSSGLGSTGGFQAGAPATAAAALDLARAAAGAESTAGDEERRRAGFALAAAGGVARAIESAQDDRTRRAVAQTVSGFASSVPTVSSTSQASASSTIASAAPAARVAPAAAATDRRQSGYGFGVPLRPRLTPAAAERAAVVFGSRAVSARARTIDPPMTDDPTIAPWVELPADRVVRTRGDRAVAGRHPRRPCTCGGRCGHGRRA